MVWGHSNNIFLGSLYWGAAGDAVMANILEKNHIGYTVHQRLNGTIEAIANRNGS